MHKFYAAAACGRAILTVHLYRFPLVYFLSVFLCFYVCVCFYIIAFLCCLMGLARLAA